MHIRVHCIPVERLNSSRKAKRRRNNKCCIYLQAVSRHVAHFSNQRSLSLSLSLSLSPRKLPFSSSLSSKKFTPPPPPTVVATGLIACRASRDLKLGGGASVHERSRSYALMTRSRPDPPHTATGASTQQMLLRTGLRLLAPGPSAGRAVFLRPPLPQGWSQEKRIMT